MSNSKSHDADGDSLTPPDQTARPSDTDDAAAAPDPTRDATATVGDAADRPVWTASDGDAAERTIDVTADATLEAGRTRDDVEDAVVVTAAGDLDATPGTDDAAAQDRAARDADLLDPTHDDAGPFARTDDADDRARDEDTPLDGLERRADADEAPAQSEPAGAPAPIVAPEPDRTPHSASAPSHAEEEHAEEEGSSFAAKALAFVVVLIAGAGLGIWAAPKVAPMLPAGMAPVAAWLTPGQAAADTEIAALRARLDEELGAVNARLGALPDAAALESQAQGLIGSATADLSAQVDALKQSLAQTDVTAATERIGRLETALQGATAELAALKDQISSGAVGISQDAAASIDTYKAELDGLRAEVGQLSGSVSGLGQRLDEAMTAAETRVAEAQAQTEQVQSAAAAAAAASAAEAETALVRAALVSGQPYAEPLAKLTEAGVTAPAGLAAAAGTGAPTLSALRQSFPDAAHEAIRASIVASAGEGVVARSTAFLQAQVASRSLTPQEGPTPDAILSRMEDALRRDDLATALSEAGQLPSEAAAAMSVWLDGAKLRAEADAGFAELSASVPTLN